MEHTRYGESYATILRDIARASGLRHSNVDADVLEGAAQLYEAKGSLTTDEVAEYAAAKAEGLVHIGAYRQKQTVYYLKWGLRGPEKVGSMVYLCCVDIGKDGKSEPIHFGLNTLEEFTMCAADNVYATYEAAEDALKGGKA